MPPVGVRGPPEAAPFLVGGLPPRLRSRDTVLMTWIKSILVVEDDADIAKLVRMHLQNEGYETTRAEDGREGIQLYDQGNFDLVLLDLMLPHVNGMDVCRHIRTDSRYVPVIMLTAKGEDANKVAGLEIGADDYITKPFSVIELVARVKAMGRRVEMLSRLNDEPGEKVLACEDLEIHIDKRIVTRGGEDLKLTQKEFEIIKILAMTPGRPYSRRTLCERAGVESFDGTDRTIDTHIKRLRAKIEPDRNRPTFVQTVWGFGYKFTDKFC
ncbi:MAG: DNA-binding response OmpR family regulator [Pseudohongiellaceae bacterium]|jgi:DNA-binding response OmpR family regulator